MQFSTGSSNDESQSRQGPRQFKHLSLLRAHLHRTVLERPVAHKAPSASPSSSWLQLQQAEGQAWGEMGLRTQGIRPVEQVNPLDILALPAQLAHFVGFVLFECFFQCWCSHSLVQHEVLKPYAPFCKGWQLDVKAGNGTHLVLNSFESDWAITNTTVFPVSNTLNYIIFLWYWLGSISKYREDQSWLSMQTTFKQFFCFTILNNIVDLSGLVWLQKWTDLKIPANI